MKKKFRGFTLIELLVVVAIIALLLSILVPSLGKAKEAARRVICGSNVNQMIMGIFLYSAAWDDKIIWQERDAQDGPIKIHPVNDIIQHDYNYWPVRLVEQGLLDWDSELSFLRCPSDRSFSIDSYPWNISYGINAGRYYGVGPDEPFTGAHSSFWPDCPWPKITHIRRPGRFASVGDSGYNPYDAAYGMVSFRMVDEHGSHFGYRHKYGCNVGFFDGHIEYKSYPDAMYDHYGQNMAIVNPKYETPLVRKEDVSILEAERFP